ncbi:MAG TPA: FAD-dependent oxidoreductase [Stellaceae bacterium]|nr:FAD-dependent oxidoreductase [Stellaceae bacterium]
MKRIVVLGGGFAGLIAAVGAARKLAELSVPHSDIAVTLVNRDGYHAIRVRNYETDLSDVRVPLADVLDPIGAELVVGGVTGIDAARHEIALAGRAPLGYDRLVLALGSELVRAPVPGLAEHGFDVDTYEAATRLADHLAALPTRSETPGRYTAVVIGGGLTGVEAAAELGTRMREIAGDAASRVIVADRSSRIGEGMGPGACEVIDEALAALRVESRPGVSVASVDAHGAVLASGERIEADTIIWCGGLKAHPLAAALPGPRDQFGRIPVDRFMKAEGFADIYAAGDIATVPLDATHASVMSCQHARPMGRIAGHNVVCDLVGAAPIPLEIGYYVTCLDLGAWGAVYCQGWDRQVQAKGDAAKQTKRIINTERIYPPRSRHPAEILATAAPVTQAPPQRFAAK